MEMGRSCHKARRQTDCRAATLEARVTALEEALAKQPADVCPYCGERAVRVLHVAGRDHRSWSDNAMEKGVVDMRKMRPGR